MRSSSPNTCSSKPRSPPCSLIYNKWLRRFPDFATLAHASEASVLHAWQGLGYYARARNLLATAAIVVNRYGGHFPHEIARMRELPGIGRYTANAIATFAFDQSVPIVEVNTARVLTRLFNFQKSVDCTAGREALWKRAAMLVPKRSPEKATPRDSRSHR